MTEARSELDGRILALIADTFGVAPDTLARDTPIEDVPGWDSLGHAVLLTRLSSRLALRLREEDAGFVATIGELLERLAAVPLPHAA